MRFLLSPSCAGDLGALVGAPIVPMAGQTASSGRAVSHEQTVTSRYSPSREVFTPWGISGLRGRVRTLSPDEPGLGDDLAELRETGGRSTDQQALVARRPGHLQHSPGLGADEPGGRVVPDVGALLDVGVEEAAGDRAEVERARAQPPDVADPRQQRSRRTSPRGSRASLLVAEAGADQPLPERYDGPGAAAAARCRSRRRRGVAAYSRPSDRRRATTPATTSPSTSAAMLTA